MGWLAPGALARLDDRLVDRIARGERLGAVIGSSIATIALGAGAYGVAFGIWRAPIQALSSAIKLPLLFLGVAACTVALSAMLAALLRARLSLVQTTVCVLLSFAIASAVLGALAPLGILAGLTAPAPDPALVGLDPDDPRVRPATEVARALLLVHVLAIAAAGTAGLARLRNLIRRLGHDDRVTIRLILAWTAAQLVAGSQLSWLLRPFFGRPHLAPSFTVDDLLEGNFFEEIWVLARTTFGDAAPIALAAALTTIALGLARSLLSEDAVVRARAEAAGLLVLGDRERLIPWPAIARAEARGSIVIVELAPDAALVRETLRIAARDREGAGALAATIARMRHAAPRGAFRTVAA